jgi:hypothetical protein
LFTVHPHRPLTSILSPKSGRGGLANAWRVLTGSRHPKQRRFDPSPVSVERTEMGIHFA